MERVLAHYPYKIVHYEIESEAKEKGVAVGKLYSIKVKQVLKILEEKRKKKAC
jgi:hypothetical protein